MIFLRVCPPPFAAVAGAAPATTTNVASKHKVKIRPDTFFDI
jgi:hypothetical protein